MSDGDSPFVSALTQRDCPHLTHLSIYSLEVIMGLTDDDTAKSHDRDIARRLIEQGGLTDDFIAMCSGLSVEEIRELKVEMFSNEE